MDHRQGEAKRDDVNYAYVAAWEWLGEAGKAMCCTRKRWNSTR
jgi:hypothetical protein